MRVLALDTAASVDAHGSHGLTVGALAGSQAAACTLLRLAPGGLVGLHEAPTGQLLVVLEGSGQVTGGDGTPQQVSVGSAVWWEAGEQHETWTEEGLLALAVEGQGLGLLS